MARTPRRRTQNRPRPESAEKSAGTRINKALAQAGVGSRRQVETFIVAGRVTVNGAQASLGQRLVPEDKVAFDGRQIAVLGPQQRRVLIYNKPVGELCTRRDPEGRPTVFEALPPLSSGRWIGVGRLDFNTSGLMLVTTDGELANRLMHPSSKIEREYAVRVLGDVNEARLEQLTKGVRLDDGMANFSRVTLGGGTGANRWYQVVLAEGRRREVRRLFEAVGTRVSRLMRVRYGRVTLPRDLPTGKWRELSQDQVEALVRDSSR